MALAVRGVGQANDSGNNPGTIVVTPNVAAQNNDLVLLFNSVSPTASAAYPTLSSSGFSTHATLSSAEWQRITVLYKIAGGSEPSSYTLTYTGGNVESGCAGVLIISGVDTATPLPTTATTTTDASVDLTFDIPSITTANDNSWWVAVVSEDGNSNVGVSSSTLISGWGASLAEDIDTGIEFATLGVAHVLRASAGATGTTSATYTGASVASLGMSIEVKVGSGTDTPLTVTNGTLTLTGQTVTLNNTAVTVQEGTLSLAGQDISLLAGASEVLPVTSGTLSLPGQDILAVYEIVWTEGALALAGQTVAFIVQQSETLAVTEGLLSLTGSPVTLAQAGDTPLPVTEGLLTLAGQDITFAVGAGSVLLDVISSLLSVSGQNVDMNPSFTLSAGTAAKRENQRRHALFGLMNKGT